MDNNEEIYKLVGKLVLESHFQKVALNKQLKDLYEENALLKQQIGMVQELKGDEQS